MDVVPIGELIVPAVRRAMEDGPTLRYRRTRDAILAACPEYAASWALELVCGLVAEGRVPEVEVQRAVDRFTRRLALGRAGQMKPITARANYLSVVLGEVLRRSGVAWKKQQKKQQKTG